MRIGLIGLLHESNTFLERPTGLAEFEQQALLTGDAIRAAFAEAHHEIGGFLAGIDEAARHTREPVELVPIFVARAFPSGTIAADAWDELLRRMFAALDAAGALDGVLVAPHGATVSERFPDADGHWLNELRRRVGAETPIVGTIDPHANLSPAMVSACDALVAYRTNPHLDQRARGIEAAWLLFRTLRGEIRPRMHAVFPPLAINIERQLTDDPHWRPVYELADRQLEHPRILSNSIVFGFPYADVAEMGSSVIAIADGDAELARSAAEELASELWKRREDFVGQLLDVDAALDRCAGFSGSVCLLDMGDNVGGGSAADGTVLAQTLHDRRLGPAFVCLYDPEAVAQAERAGAGATLELSVGGKTDKLHGPPLRAEFHVVSLQAGRFREPQPRHGGIAEFDQGRTAILETGTGLTVMLTSRRMVPFSLEQLRSCGLKPDAFRLMVAKGVNAPVAAYREVCRHFLRVDTPGSTRADMTRLPFRHRRKPMHPFELDVAWSV